MWGFRGPPPCFGWRAPALPPGSAEAWVGATPQVTFPIRCISPASFLTGASPKGSSPTSLVWNSPVAEPLSRDPCETWGGRQALQVEERLEGKQQSREQQLFSQEERNGEEAPRSGGLSELLLLLAVCLR